MDLIFFEEKLLSALNKKALQDTKEILAEYSIDEKFLKRLIMEKLSINYPVSENLKIQLEN